MTRCSALNPRIVLAESSAFGDTGPWSNRMGYGPLVRATAGVSKLWTDRAASTRPTGRRFSAPVLRRDHGLSRSRGRPDHRDRRTGRVDPPRPDRQRCPRACFPGRGRRQPTRRPIRHRRGTRRRPRRFAGRHQRARSLPVRRRRRVVRRSRSAPMPTGVRPQRFSDSPNWPTMHDSRPARRGWRTGPTCWRRYRRGPERAHRCRSPRPCSRSVFPRAR